MREGHGIWETMKTFRRYFFGQPVAENVFIRYGKVKEVKNGRSRWRNRFKIGGLRCR